MTSNARTTQTKMAKMKAWAANSDNSDGTDANNTELNEVVHFLFIPTNHIRHLVDGAAECRYNRCKSSKYISVCR